MFKLRIQILGSLFFIFLSWSTGLLAQSFEDVTTLLGIDHSYGSDAFGGGISFHDFDQDGWDDITFATQLGDSVVFYKNTGTGFQEVYFEGVHHAGHVKQVLWCDYDNDGDKDLYISGRSWDNFIYINDGSFVFTPYLLEAPAPFFTGDTYCAAFGDYDLDGDLDLFIGNHIASIPLSNQLFLNNGDGTMTDITPSFYFDSIYLLTFAASWVDLNNDLLPDLYTAEDRFGANQLYMNGGNGSLTDDCDSCGAEIVINAMSVCPGDYDKDGDLDVYVSNTEEGNALLRNNGDGTFTDVAATSGVSYNRVAWGATFFDFDNDRDFDLYVSGSTNGTTMTNELYTNLDGFNFTEANAGFVGDSTRSFSHAIGDINNDGYYDIAVLNITPDNSQLWRCSGGSNNWIKILLEGTVSNKEGIGSWIEVWSAGERQVHYTTCGVGYLAQNSGYVIFGLGQETTVDSIIVKWTSGLEDKLYDQGTNQLITIVEGSNISTSNSDLLSDEISLFPNPFSNYLYLRNVDVNLISKTFKIYTINGAEITANEFIPINENTVKLDIQNIPVGNYILGFSIEEEEVRLKIVKRE